MKPIEFFLAYRFLKEGRSQTLLIFGGAAAGVAVIVFLASLIIGLQQSTIDRTLGLQADLSVQPAEERFAEPLRSAGESEFVFHHREPRPRRQETIDDWRRLADDIGADPDVTEVSPVASGAGSVIRGQVSEPAQLFGIDPALHTRIIEFHDDIVAGQLRVGDRGVVIGVEMAEELAVGVGDRIRLSIPQRDSRSFTVRGIFDLGAGQANQTWVFVSLRDAQTMLGIGDEVTAIDVAVDELFDADDIAERLDGRTTHQVESWQEANRQLLRALRTQAASTILIGVFVAIAVALGIASVLIVSVVQKRGQVGVLRAMGAPMNTVLRVFLIQGGAVGLVGSVVGSVAGTVLALGFNQFVRDEAGEIIFPIEPSPTIFTAAFVVATLTGIIAAIAPARRAARLDPADAITHG